jgi:uncharacterized protein
LITIFDPIHGTIELSRQELSVIDSRPFQRLRYIKQLGFAELAFPGATHSRYAHSLGAMHVATLMIDALLPALPVSKSERAWIRQAVRLAVLLHDLGHPPLSHVTEQIMPQASGLGLAGWIDDPTRQATHEDYTLKFLCDSDLTDLLAKEFEITGAQLAALVYGQAPAALRNTFVMAGHNWLPLLHQIVSGELDADRMDYLRRDAYYCGVSYGQFDFHWLIKNLTTVEHQGQHVLALKHKGVWAFENFLLSRYHMFLSVYYHHTSVCFEYLLRRYFETSAYTLPTDCETYLQVDDVHLITSLRQSNDPWAQSIVNRKPYHLLIETHDFGQNQTPRAVDALLENAGIAFFRTKSHGVLSKYFPKRHDVAPLLVLEPELGRVSRIEDYTPLYKRFDEVVGVSRLYCSPLHIDKARRILRQQTENVA